MLKKPKLHNSAQLLAEEPLTIETPPAQWAYAAEFDIERPDAGACEVIIDLEAKRGEVGIGLLTPDGSQFHIERHIGSEERRTTATLRLEPGQMSNQLILRNIGASGTNAEVVVHSIEIGLFGDRDASVQIPRIDVSSHLLQRFRGYAGRVPAGFWVNWLGVLTRTHVWPFSLEVKAKYAKEREEQPAYPVGDEHVLDWIPLLEAVVSSRETFRMIALGAGWGRWLTAGAFAARQLNLPFHLTGVEAEPEHFAWMREHMGDNRIPAECCHLIFGAASPTREDCWFPVAAPEWYGQSIVANSHVQNPGPDQHEALVDGRRLRRVPAVTLDELLTGDGYIDYIHMDIQGTEYDFLSSAPERLDRCVRTVNIGTHSDFIERRLRVMFGQLGWESRYDISIGSSADVAVDGRITGRVQFGDGVQVWCNPRLTILSSNPE